MRATILTSFITDSPHQQINTGRICHYIDLILVDDYVGWIIHPVNRAVVLLVLQLSLSDQK